MTSIDDVRSFHKAFLQDPDLRTLEYRGACFDLLMIEAALQIIAFFLVELSLISKKTSIHTFRTIERVGILLAFAATGTVVETARTCGKSRGTVYLHIVRMVEAFITNGGNDDFDVLDLMHDRRRSGRPPAITNEMRVRVIATTTVSPQTVGHYASFWTITTLHEHIVLSNIAEQTDHSFVGPIKPPMSRATVARIVKSAGLAPHAVRYYLARRDPDFDAKALKILEVLQFGRFMSDGNISKKVISSDDATPKRHKPVISECETNSGKPYSLPRAESSFSKQQEQREEVTKSPEEIAKDEKKKETSLKREKTRKQRFNEKLALLKSRWTWYDCYLNLKSTGDTDNFLKLSRQYAERYEIICTDEKPGVQLLGRVADQLPMKLGTHKTVSEDHEFIRHGTADILVAVNLSSQKTIATLTESHTGADHGIWLRKIRDSVPITKTILLIEDNHSSHLTPENIEYLTDPCNKFEVIMTPTHGSWLDPTEPVFAILSKQVLRLGRYEHFDTLHRNVSEWAERRFIVPKWLYSPEDFLRKQNRKNSQSSA